MLPTENERHNGFLRLFAVTEPALRAFVRSLVPRREDVPEVMQEVAVVLWRKFDELTAAEDFRKWAFGVARLEALAWARDKARDRHVFDPDLLVTLAEAAERASQRLGPQREALEQCLSKLPSDRRQLVLTAYAPGMSIEQLAVQRGQTPMSLYKVLHRIRLALVECTRRALAQEQYA
jgi:RNA polymerase sigma-70 factor (ECF subfamily)